MRSRRNLCALLAALLTVALAGCGGSGSSSKPSPFAGSYSGTFTDPGNNQSGTFTLSVAMNGQTTGSIQNTTTGAHGPVSGSVNNDGTVTLTITYPNQTITDKGVVTFSGNGHLIGNVTEYNGNTQVGTATNDLIKQ